MSFQTRNKHSDNRKGGSHICLVFDQLTMFHIVLWSDIYTRGKNAKLVGYSPWGCEESDTTEQLHFHFSLSCLGEGNGNPLQCSCLENPRDGGSCWAAVYGVAQSRTQLKWLSSSSSRSQDLVQAGLTILYLSRWRVSRMDRHILIFYIWIFLEIAKQQEDPLGICSALKKMKSAHATMWKQKETICCNGWMDIHGHYFYLVFLKPWK